MGKVTGTFKVGSVDTKEDGSSIAKLHAQGGDGTNNSDFAETPSGNIEVKCDKDSAAQKAITPGALVTVSFDVAEVAADTTATPAAENKEPAAPAAESEEETQ